MTLYVPGRVREEQLAVRRQHEARLAAMVGEHSKLEQWNKELKEIDPYLELVRAHENASAPGLKPGYYHVLRHNPGAPPSLIPVETDEGEFREPDSNLFDQLRHWDGWDNRVTRDREVRAQKLERARDRQKAREHEERLDEAMLRLKAYNEPGVLFGDNRWTHRAGAKRGRRAA